MNTDHIFVYGLLKSTYTNDAAKLVRSHCEVMGEGTFPGYLYDLGKYPGAVYDASSPYTVHGEVFKITYGKEALIQFLDDFEDVGPQFEQPNEYRKEVLPILIKAGIIHASCYVFNRSTEGKKLVESGRYENIAGTRE